MPNKLVIRVMIVANGANWVSWPGKIYDIVNFFAPLCSLDIHITQTNFSNIPFAKFAPSLTQYESFNQNVPVLEVDEAWYDAHITPLGEGYDIVVLVLPHPQWPLLDAVVGVTQLYGPKPVRIQVGADENEGFYINGNLIFKTVQHYLEHELLHALFYITGSADTTHYWDFAKGNLAGALNDVHFPVPKAPSLPNQSVWEYVVEGYKLLLLAFRKELMNPETSMLDKMCLAIQQYEGYIPPGINAAYPQGTLAWRNNNPGNLRYAGQFLATGKDRNGFAIFKTYGDGYNTLKNMINRGVTGVSKLFHPSMTLLDFFRIYSPSFDHNDPNAYANFVAKQMGVDVNTWTLGQMA